MCIIIKMIDKNRDNVSIDKSKIIKYAYYATGSNNKNLGLNMDINAFLTTEEKDVSIAILGDLCIDQYYFIDNTINEKSVETGLDTMTVGKVKIDVGAAANVAVNCKHLGIKNVDIYGIVGDDPYGEILLQLLKKESVETKGIAIQTDNWNTHVYHKIYQDGEEKPRFDIGNYNEPADKCLHHILQTLKNNLERYVCIIINEQVYKGLHTNKFQHELKALIASSPTTLTWFSDCRSLNDTYRDTIHKLNKNEALKIVEKVKNGQQYSENELVGFLYDYWKLPIILTRGEDGALIHDGTSIKLINGLHFAKRIDPVGGGDAFMAGMVSAFAAKVPLYESAIIGNFTAGVSIQKLYETGHPTLEEVRAISVSPKYRYNIHLAEHPEEATYFKNTGIEIISSPSTTTDMYYPSVAIFDHDGTISTVRQGWETVMFGMMVEAITKSTYVSEKELETVKRIVSEYIEQSTGIQTISQMYDLVDMIKDFGYVKANEILDPVAYKKIYNNLLRQHIKERRDLCRDGVIMPEELTIKGAIAMLHHLSDGGTVLYLASGTDEEDVKEEAAILGYARLFKGGIYGSVGNKDMDPKKVVMQAIIRSIKKKQQRSQCVVFGDGPVELREGKQNNFLTIGVASNEKNRSGLNLTKRKRLVLAGADLIIPDFSVSTELYDLLGWKKDIKDD